jgi:hypothetical protein
MSFPVKLDEKGKIGAYLTDFSAIFKIKEHHYSFILQRFLQDLPGPGNRWATT